MAQKQDLLQQNQSFTGHLPGLVPGMALCSYTFHRPDLISRTFHMIGSMAVDGAWSPLLDGNRAGAHPGHIEVLLQTSMLRMLLVTAGLGRPTECDADGVYRRVG